MNNFMTFLDFIIEQDENYLEIAENKLLTLPEGRLKTSRKNGETFYYVRTPDGKYRYISKSETALIEGLANREKYEGIAKRLRGRLKFLRKCRKVLAKFDWQKFLDDFPEGKAQHFDTSIVSDKQYAALWVNASSLVECDDFHTINTKKGDYVRSKSEKIIADMLFDLGIPYRYEDSLILKDGQRVYPDFTILDCRTREEVIIEHLGILDHPEYSTKNLQKITAYENSGYHLDDSLFLTYETACFKYPFEKLEYFLKKRFSCS